MVGLIRARQKSRAIAALASALLFQFLPAPQALADSPMFNFLQHCVGCHQIDGSGLPPEVPNLRKDFGYLIGSPQGRDFMTRVPGVVGAPLPASDVAKLVNWMVNSFYPGVTFEPFTEAEILAGRERPLHDPMKQRLELIAGN